MKTIWKAATDSSEEIKYDQVDNIGAKHIAFRKFKEGVEFAQTWYPVTEIPTVSCEVLLRRETPVCVGTRHRTGTYFKESNRWECGNNGSDVDFFTPTHYRLIELD